MEARRFEKQPGLVKAHKIATVLMFACDSFNKRKKMQDGAGYGTIIRQEISELSARVALTIGDAARVFRLIQMIIDDSKD